MSTPGEKLAESLEKLKIIQDQELVAIKASDLTRVHRERLVKNGFIREVIKGWYILVPHDEQKYLCSVMTTEREFKEKIIAAAEKAIVELILVAKEPILNGGAETDLSADKLKNAAATKKLAIMDAFDILKRIQEEKNILDAPEAKKTPDAVETKKGFAERFSK